MTKKQTPPAPATADLAAAPYYLLIPDAWDPDRQNWRTWVPETLKEVQAGRDLYARRFPTARPARIVRVDVTFTEIHGGP